MVAPYSYAYVGRPDRIAEVVFGVKTYSFSPGRGGVSEVCPWLILCTSSELHPGFDAYRSAQLYHIDLCAFHDRWLGISTQVASVDGMYGVRWDCTQSQASRFT
eukprot:SAG31_NODE_13316_length_878_cov_0.612323_2_plen_104_part_00